ncbi:hypothetical protein ACH5RR_027133 [Cinchona calisaya]|uniref:Uncharacterized protein n=1 Tax=Cinchona calisaya TaxID=153742 RepID=A0ABD2Z4L8_9GENT
MSAVKLPRRFHQQEFEGGGRLFQFIHSNTEARPLKVAEALNSMDEGIMTKIGELFVQGIKTGGPGDKGRGQKLINGHSLQVIKNSGPSPGDGH